MASRAGVSEAAVSYALNGRPGVSEDTRQRVLAAARELGWAPNIAARSLGTARANAVGIVLVRPPRTMIIDSYLTQMLSGVEAGLNRNGIGLLLHLVDRVDDTVDVYRRWWAGRHVDGVIVSDVRQDDPRIDALIDIGLPAAIIGGPRFDAVSAVDVDTAGTAQAIIDYLRAIGHRSLARVAGVRELFHTGQRDAACLEAIERAGLGRDRYQVVYTDYSAAAGMQAMIALMSGNEPPSAVIFDNDVMAAAALKVAHDMGVAVPGDVAIVAWDDSDLCQITVPTLTAIQQRPAEQAELTVGALLRQMDTGEVTHTTVPPGTLTVRQSTVRVRGRS
ncbi:LacI family DNA-binding transcriptional regulator [Dactylosporangium sp. CA-052675]|uniref:LacI family DNA-binding transcriptional regulator n=1 Tax=Dactylosporangium sp. CA-052675 TaxID=3239927 RepID=UPI003D8BC945